MLLKLLLAFAFLLTINISSANASVKYISSDCIFCEASKVENDTIQYFTSTCDNIFTEIFTTLIFFKAYKSLPISITTYLSSDIKYFLSLTIPPPTIA